MAGVLGDDAIEWKEVVKMIVRGMLAKKGIIASDVRVRLMVLVLGNVYERIMDAKQNPQGEGLYKFTKAMELLEELDNPEEHELEAVRALVRVQFRQMEQMAVRGETINEKREVERILSLL